MNFNRDRWSVVGMAVAVSFLMFASCGDDDEQPPKFAVTGTITDGDGAPVASARVALEYRLELTGSMQAGTFAGTPIVFHLLQPSEWLIRITDYAGNFVRQFEGSSEPGETHVQWDGNDADGNPVPDGVYFYTLEAGDFKTTKKMLVMALCEGMRSSDASLTLTDADGKYAILWDIVPLGEEFAKTDSAGQVIGMEKISDTVTVCAWDGELHSSDDVTLSKGKTAVRNLTIQ